jgi:hypothetical protein
VQKRTEEKTATDLLDDRTCRLYGYSKNAYVNKLRIIIKGASKDHPARLYLTENDTI